MAMTMGCQANMCGISLTQLLTAWRSKGEPLPADHPEVQVEAGMSKILCSREDSPPPFEALLTKNPFVEHKA